MGSPSRTCCDPSTSPWSTCQGPYTPGVSEPRPATYGYEELASRIEEVLGERPSRSALRAAGAQGRRTGSTATKPRLTVGMPAPRPAESRTAPSAFDVEEVETWLENHPRLVWSRAVRDAQEALQRGDDVEKVIAGALGRGLSWRTVTALLVEHDGHARTLAGVHKRYRHLAPSSS